MSIKIKKYPERTNDVFGGGRTIDVGDKELVIKWDHGVGAWECGVLPFGKMPMFFIGRIVDGQVLVTENISHDLPSQLPSAVRVAKVLQRLLASGEDLGEWEWDTQLVEEAEESAVIGHDLSSSETEKAVGILEDALALFAERGEPLDRHDDIKFQGEMHWRNTEVVTRGSKMEFGLFPVECLLFGTEFSGVASDLIAKFWHRNLETSPSIYIDTRVRNVFPVHSNGHPNAEGFVLSSVDDLAGCRIYPVVIPADVIRFSVASFGPAANRVRFLCELACIYRNAVGFTRESVGLNRRLLASLRNVVGLLRIELRPYRNDECENSGGSTNDGE